MWKPIRIAPLGVLLAGVVPSSGQAQLTTPTDWRWITDRPAPLVTGQEVPDSAWRFVTMPPGWHVTTGPGALIFHPGFEGRGRYSVETEIFLFPGEGQEEYGVFLGGTDLEGSGRSYTAFVVRRDGSAAIIARQGMESRFLMSWARAEAVVPHPGGNETAKNILRVEVEPAKVVFRVNGTEVGSAPRSSGAFEGRFGFRAGAKVNLHVSRLDLTQHLALPPRNQSP